MKRYGPLFFVAEALRGLRANSLVNLLAVGTISMAMLIVCFFLVVFVNMRSAADALGDRLGLSVYLKDTITGSEKDYLYRMLTAEPGVKTVSFFSKDAALALLRKELKDQQDLIAGLGGNPLPDSYEISVDRRYVVENRLDALAKKIEKMPGVAEVSYGKEGARVIAGISRALTVGGVVLAVLLGVTVVFIISNSVRLALYSRGPEIELMQWIGATRGFIQTPFLIEGMLLAMLGAALAVGVLGLIYLSLPKEVVLFLSRPAGLDFLPPAVVSYLIVGSGLLGLFGALISVNGFLE